MTQPCSSSTSRPRHWPRTRPNSSSAWSEGWRQPAWQSSTSLTAYRNCTLSPTPVTVLRDGHHIGTVAMQETSVAEIVQMMFGEIAQRERPDDLQPGTNSRAGGQGPVARGRLHRCELHTLRRRNSRHRRDAGRGPHRTAARPLRRRRLRPRTNRGPRPAHKRADPPENEGAGLGLYA